MSWEAYVQNMCDKGAYQCGVYTKHGVVCAQSPNFKVTPEEVLAIMKCIDGVGDEVSISIGGSACTKIHCDLEEGSVIAKSKLEIFESNKVFYHAEATKGLVIICGKFGGGERGACQIAHDISHYLKGVGH